MIMTQKIIHRFLRDEHGSIIILVGLSIFLLVAVGGIALDLGKQQLINQRIQQSADFAALAASVRPDNSYREGTGHAYFQLNYPSRYMGLDRPTPTVSSPDNAIVTVKASQTVPMNFISLLGTSEVEAAGSTYAQVPRYPTLDLMLVMDNSGSMDEEDTPAPTLYLAGDKSKMKTVCNVASPENPSGCKSNVDNKWNKPTRLNALRYTADSLANKLLNVSTRDHRIGIVTWDKNVITWKNFDDNYSHVNDDLMGMATSSGTNSAVGMQRAETIINDNARSGEYTKALILFTDGENTVTNANSDTLAACGRLKANNVLIFTILYDPASESPDAIPMLSDCANGPNGTSSPKPNENLYFFPVRSSEALNDAFNSILETLNRVRMRQ